MKRNNNKIISGKKKPINIDVEELQKCADFIAQLIVGNTDKYAPLMVIYDRLEREIEIARFPLPTNLKNCVCVLDN